MRCFNRICIHHIEGFCTNNEDIEIDWHGMCKNMIPARITGEQLEQSKFYTKMVLDNSDYYFDNENGIVTMTESAIEYYDNEE